jgi:hypothetical protein
LGIVQGDDTGRATGSNESRNIYRRELQCRNKALFGKIQATNEVLLKESGNDDIIAEIIDG